VSQEEQLQHYYSSFILPHGKSRSISVWNFSQPLDGRKSRNSLADNKMKKEEKIENF
jgi:hypothetical protein